VNYYFYFIQCEKLVSTYYLIMYATSDCDKMSECPTCIEFVYEYHQNPYLHYGGYRWSKELETHEYESSSLIST